MTLNALARALRMDTRSADRLRAIACEHLPRPAPVPDAERITSAAAELVARWERSEAETVRPGGVR